MGPSAKLLRSGFIVLLGVALLLAGILFLRGKAMPATAHRFLAAASASQWSTARAHLSKGLRSETDEAWLQNLLRQTGISHVTAENWTASQSGHGRGELSGNLITADGSSVPVQFLFVREQLDWKLYAIRRPFLAALPQPIDPPFPNRSQQVALVKRAMRDFAASVNSRNMSYFHTTLAPSRQEKYSIEILNQAFGRFFAIEEDLASLETIEPAVDQPAEERGEFTLRGSYASAPKKVFFVQKYCYEEADWQLLSFKIEMQ